MTFKVGDMVKRKPVGKIKMDNPEHHHGRIAAIESMVDNQGRKKQGYLVQTLGHLATLKAHAKNPDSVDKWDLKEAQKGTAFLHEELNPLKVPAKKKKSGQDDAILGGTSGRAGGHAGIGAH